MRHLESYGRGVMMGAVVLFVSALVIVGLLTGACGSSAPPPGHCWRPGQCYDTTAAGESVFSCSSPERFEIGRCSAILRVGACVTPPNIANHRVYLYAPMHGILPPDCAGMAGQGSYFIRE